MRRWIILVLIACCIQGLAAHAAENQVSNPGFEEQADAKNFPAGGWWLAQSFGETRVTVDRTIAHGGMASARFESAAEEKSVLVCQKFAVAAGDDIQFDAWVRGAGLPAAPAHAYAGVVFRDADNKILERHYGASRALDGEWSPISVLAKAPVEVAFAEIHLGYTNGPNTIWYDDVSAVITNEISLSLAETLKPWPGKQDLALRVTNRLSTKLNGRLSVKIGPAEKSIPVVLSANAGGIFRVPAVLAGAGPHAYRISLTDSAGNELRAIQGKFKVPPPLVLFPPDPCYDVAGDGIVDTLIDAQMNFAPAAREGMKFSIQLNHDEPRMTAVSATGMTEMSLPISTAAPGVFELTARAIDSSGREVATAKTDIHVIARGGAEVKIGPDGFLRVAGKPEFPIGLYSSSRDAELAAAGFNSTHNYNVSTGNAADAINAADPQLKDLLDESWAHGLRMMVELPRKAIEKGEWAQVRRRLLTFRHHPGLLCWGSEERVARGMAKPANIAALYALVHQLDPDHPLVLGDTRDVIEKLQVDRRDFFPDASMDAGIWWWYPVPMKPAKASALEGREAAAGDVMEAPSWLTTTHSKKPLWIAIQSYQKPARDARFPTPAEYRCEAYSSIIYGVKGLYFYCGSGQKDFEGKPSGILNKPELGHWDYVKQLAGELRDFSPVIMAPPAPAKVELSPTNEMVIFATRELDGKTYLIAANKSGQPQSATWQGELLQNKKVTTLFETHSAKIESGTLSDNFAAYAVHVYRLE